MCFNESCRAICSMGEYPAMEKLYAAIDEQTISIYL